MTAQAGKRKANALVERSGVNAVEGIFVNQFGWLFREQHESDWGVDAQVEVVRNGMPTGMLLAVQIKAGSSYFRSTKSGYIYRGKLRHLKYWNDHSLPVLLVLAHPETGAAVCHIANKKTATVSEKAWSVEIPRENILDARLKPFVMAAAWSKSRSLDVPYRRFLSHIEAMERPVDFLKAAKAGNRSNLDDKFARTMFALLEKQVRSDARLLRFSICSGDAPVIVKRAGHEMTNRGEAIMCLLLPRIAIYAGYEYVNVTDSSTSYTVARSGFLELLEYLLDNQRAIQSREVVILPEGYSYSWDSYPDGIGDKRIDMRAILAVAEASCTLASPLPASGRG